MTTWRMHIVYWKPKATDTHTYTHARTGCVILINLPLQQWLHERTTMVRYTYIVCLVFFFRNDTILMDVQRVFMKVIKVHSVSFR